MQITIVHRDEHDLDDWQGRFDAGIVPDERPYGLHKLARHGLEPQWVGIPEASPVGKAMEVLRPPRLATTGEWTLAWDEYVASRYLAAGGRPRLATGIVWLTDELRRSATTRVKAHALLRAISHAELAWVLSRAQIEPLRRAWPGRAPRVEHLLFGVATDFFTPRPFPAQQCVLSVGNDRDRDHSTLFEALSIVHRERPLVRLRVQLKNSVTVPDGVEVLPFLSHAALNDAYADATVVAVATRPNLHVSGMTVALEAMSAGRPIVMTRTPGVDDYVADERWGLLASPGDAAELARRLLDALDAETAERLGREGRRAASTSYSTDAMSARLASMLAP